MGNLSERHHDHPHRQGIGGNYGSDFSDGNLIVVAADGQPRTL